MIPIPQFADKSVAVFGLGRSGLSTAAALVAGGARVSAWDDKAPSRDAAAAAGIALVEPSSVDWRNAAALVLSPGVPLTHPEPHPVVGMAKAGGCEILGDIELLLRARPEATRVGITGTNGKSTTTALLGHILEFAGRPVAVGGNIGRPALELDALDADGVYVLEVSSYQLDLMPRGEFDIAVLINISADHLDRHGGMDGYVAAKKRILRNPASGFVAVIGVDDPHAAALAEDMRRQGRRVLPISAAGPVQGGVYATGGRLFDAIDGDGEVAADLSSIQTLPGRHNWQNAAAAFATARVLGLSADAILAGMRSYPGLAHRQERVAEIGTVSFVNDSKATNGDAAARALVCYDAIYWIAGGLAKADGLQDVLPHLDRVRHAFLIGEAAGRFESEIAGRVPVTMAGTLETAVTEAFAAAKRDGADHPVVLLSPACASFDQFANFEARGDAFRAQAQALAEARS